MIERKKLKTAALIAGMAAAGLLATAPAGAATQDETTKDGPALFALGDLPGAIVVAGTEGSCGEGQCGEGQCGEGSCGEGSCGDEG